MNCNAAPRISSSVSGGSKLNGVFNVSAYRSHLHFYQVVLPGLFIRSAYRAASSLENTDRLRNCRCSSAGRRPGIDRAYHRHLRRVCADRRTPNLSDSRREAVQRVAGQVPASPDEYPLSSWALARCAGPAYLSASSVNPRQADADISCSDSRARSQALSRQKPAE